MSAEGRSTVEVLRAARERISDPERWTQGWFAREKQAGEKVAPTSEEASCWCAVGSLMAELGLQQGLVIGRRSFGEPGRCLMAASEEIDGTWSPEGLNDRYVRHRSHRRVLALYDRAIEKAEAI